MLPVTAQFARSASESAARSALPGARVVVALPVRTTAPRRAAASGLRALADRLAPETAAGTRWQGA